MTEIKLNPVCLSLESQRRLTRSLDLARKAGRMGQTCSDINSSVVHILVNNCQSTFIELSITSGGLDLPTQRDAYLSMKLAEHTD